ncbi:ParB/RepB/Spo0J family partition protein [Burkholderiaceae bacterium DAT-1]|nr:ParB/RepB/Spo0J family partition protein [Burkholderiaceae bacterium DAT-1]
MSKKLSDLLAERANAQLKKHHDAVQTVEFDEGKRHERIAVDSIAPNPYQPRRLFDEAKLNALAESIKHQGLIHPISLRMVEHGKYEIVAGERRWRAVKLNGGAYIDAIVGACSDDDMLINAMTENIARDDLTDFEKALQIRSMIAHFDESKTSLAARLGMERSDLYRYLAFFDLPESALALLEAQPNLLSRRFAEDVKKAISKSDDKVLAEANLLEGLRLVSEKLLEPSSLAAHVLEQPKLVKPVTTALPLSTFMIGNKKVGSMVVKGKQLQLTLPLEHVDVLKQKQLSDFVTALLLEHTTS